MVSVLHKNLEWKEKKIKCMKLGGHATNDKKIKEHKNKIKSVLPAREQAMPDQSTRSITVVLNQYSLSFLNFVVKNKKGGDKGRGLLTFFPRKGDLVVRGD